MLCVGAPCWRMYSSLQGLPAELFSSRSLAELTTCAAKGPLLRQVTAGSCPEIGTVHVPASAAGELVAYIWSCPPPSCLQPLRQSTSWCGLSVSWSWESDLGVFQRHYRSNGNHENTCTCPLPVLCMMDPVYSCTTSVLSSLCSQCAL